MNQPRILFSMPTRHHIEIALDELTGLQDLGYPCDQFPYAARDGVTTASGRLKVIIENAYNLVKIAKSFKPDVIYFNSRLEVLAGVRDYLTILLFKTLYRGKVKFVIKSHGSDIEVLQRKNFVMQHIVLPYLKKNVDGWLFLSSEEKNNINRISYFSSEKIFVTKNIVRTDHFETDPDFKIKLNIPKDHQILLFVGRLIKEKGIFEVLNAFAKLLPPLKVSLIIVGWGEELEKLKQLSVKLGIEENVIFTGFIPEQDVVPFYANCDVLVFPTFFPEGFPMALFNSVSAGMAVITTPTRAASDYLSDPENCLWVAPQNVENVYSAMKRLLGSKPLMESIKQNNLKKGSEFNQKQVCKELSEIINQVIA